MLEKRERLVSPFAGCHGLVDDFAVCGANGPFTNGFEAAQVFGGSENEESRVVQLHMPGVLARDTKADFFAHVDELRARLMGHSPNGHNTHDQLFHVLWGESEVEEEGVEKVNGIRFGLCQKLLNWGIQSQAQPKNPNK